VADFNQLNRYTHSNYFDNKPIFPLMKSTSFKHYLFYCIAICLPLALLLLLEFGLRVAGYGNVYPLFIKAPQLENYLQANPDIIKRYFPQGANTPNVAPDTYYFKADKPDNTLRIVTMGGSTMAGFPYGRFASPAGMLKQRLKAQYPDRNIEVISVAMSSINTYTLLDILDEVLDISPDAVLIYAGHNEYLGVMGVGSSFASKGGHVANLIYLSIYEWRTFQWLQNIYYRLTSLANNPKNNASANQHTVMAQVAKNKHIVFNDDVYQAGVNQFEQNLGAILKQLSDAKVPVFISNLVANELDQAPFESISEPELDALSQSISAQSVAISAPMLALANEHKHANFMYALAKRYLASGDTISAHSFFVRALNYDLLRFRAPSIFNTIIKQQAKQYNAHLVDSYAFMHQHAKHNIIGNEHMLEHLHPNHRGYFLLAEVFFNTLKETTLLPSDPAAPRNEEIRQQQAKAWSLSPITLADEFYAQYKIRQLTSDYPFSKEKRTVPAPKASSAIEAIGANRIQGQSWVTMQQALLKYHQDMANNLLSGGHAKESLEYHYERAANSAGLLFDALPNQDKFARAASLFYLRAQQFPLAKYYALKAVSLSPKDVLYRLSLAEIHYKLKDIDASLEQLDEVLNLSPQHTQAKQLKLQLQSERRALSAY